MTKSALERFEAVVDAAFDSQQLPHPNGHVAAWYLLTVSEDAQRILFVDPSKEVDNWRVEYFLDRYKFSLRQCLAAVRRNPRCR